MTLGGNPSWVARIAVHCPAIRATAGPSSGRLPAARVTKKANYQMKASMNKLLGSLLVVLLISTEIKDAAGGPRGGSHVQKKSCGNPGDVYNGHYDLSEGVDFGAVITASCRAGYHLIGESKRTCLANGEWDGRPAVCEVVNCSSPIVPHARRVDGGSEPYGYGDSVRYRCDSGYMMVNGTGNMVCLEHGWTSPPTCEVVCTTPLGLKDGQIKNGQVTASSVYSESFWGGSWTADAARLDNEGRVNAWSPNESDRSQWLQVDLDSPKTVTGIITQGAKDLGRPKYVTEFKISYSNDGSSWTEFSSDGNETIFQGNTDNDSHQTNMFDPPFDARYVRFLPWAWHKRITLRTELLGYFAVVKGSRGALLALGRGPLWGRPTKLGPWPLHQRARLVGVTVCARLPAAGVTKKANYQMKASMNKLLWSLLVVLLISTEIKGVVGDCSRSTISDNAVLDEENYEESSIARLKCQPGYEPTPGSPRTVTCSGGQWRPSPSRFKCQKKSCGNPGDIYNGLYDFSEGIEFGAIITASCKTGYHLIGESNRTCLANGEWDGSPAVCEVVKCGPPPIVPDGHTQNPPKEAYEFGEVVEYECSSGYTLLGDSVTASTVHCLSNASWSHVPRCKMVNCSSPIVPHARRVDGGSEPYGYGDSVRYRCDDGFRMVNGTGDMVCLEHGWTSPPTCEVLVHSQKNLNTAINVLQHATKVSKPQIKILSRVSEKGARWLETSRNEKGLNGRSSVCVSTLPYIQHLFYIFFKNSVVNHHTCLTPSKANLFILVSREMNRPRIWITGTMSCGLMRPRPVSETGVVGDCSRSTISDNAVLDEENYEESSTARLKCHPGYEPTPGSPRTVTCSGGQWRPSPSRFKCQKKSCGNPGDIYNGLYDFSAGIEFGAVITASCKAGYRLIGESKRTCLANGEWDGRPAVCEVVKCGPPPIVPDGHTQNPSKDEYEFGEVVEYECSSGYTLLGDGVTAASTVHCLSNASWSHVPRCKMVNCNSPMVPHARRVEGGSEPYGYGDSVRYKCDDGFRMVKGTGKMVCQEHGWTSPPTCEAVCTTPLGLKDGRIKNRQMTASSVLVEKFWGGIWDVYCARLDNNEERVNAWSPHESDRSQWLQVDLNRPKTVTGIVTQGAKDLGVHSFVTEFKVAYSDNGYSWRVVSSGGEETIFQGNKDNNGHQTNMFDPPFEARYIRFLPWDWVERITLRMELLGC
ncbi:sushi, von Willebrand factor type A, EGF and pentraxin domain-containing protein 1-like [Engraulis encrasicolus]|uniref:sushi, von Willebrand factor type A, EGF and pentraxin domain-containing protein 1-like n=1 Tax=Engraulis encrasicolus TaxID=184585 RepID=UPI002FD2804D